MLSITFWLARWLLPNNGFAAAIQKKIRMSDINGLKDKHLICSSDGFKNISHSLYIKIKKQMQFHEKKHK